MRRGLARSRSEAQELIAGRRVTVRGAPATKPSTLVGQSEAVVVDPPPQRFASRGGLKLAGALEALAVDPAGRHCLDAGASTGGFTDALLQGGAARVIAVDVGYGQLAWHLRVDPRVVVLDRTNVRTLTAEDIPPPLPSLVVADLSFISLTLVLPALRRVADPAADHLLLVKPQFEAGADRVGKGGVVRDPATWKQTIVQVAAAAAAEGLGVVGAAPSPLPGPAGNIEFFLLVRAGGDADPDATADAAVAAARALQSGP